MTEIIGRAKVIVSGDVDSSSVSRSGGVIERALKKTVLGAGTAVGAVLGTAIAKGFQRLSSIEEAEAKLKGLGNSAKDVTLIMENALASVKGTAFGLGDAATIAASAVASGVQPGKELERTLRLVGDAATIGGTSLAEMGSIFNKVSATGKAQTDVLNQLGDRGIPIVQLLAKELGITSEQVYEFAKDGKINFETFQKAIEDGMGGAALKSGETFKGALANAGAALGRFGAALLGPSFKDGPGVFAAITAKIDELTPAAEDAGKSIHSFAKEVGHLQKSKDLQELTSGTNKFGDRATFAAGAVILLKGYLKEIGHSLKETAKAFGFVIRAVKSLIGAYEKLFQAGRKVGKYLRLNTPDPGPSNQGHDLTAEDLLGGPGLASGGPARGLRRVGENGVELVDFGSSGGYVYNNSQTRDMLSGGGNFTLVNNNYGPVSGSDVLAEYKWANRFAPRFGALTATVAG